MAVFIVLTYGCTRTYPYLVLNEGCHCEEYRIADREAKVTYIVRAEYSMNGAIVTKVRIDFQNNSIDTLYLDLGTVKISSLNITYQYNNKVLPLPSLVIPPRQRNFIELEGRDISPDENEWHKIAGEQLQLTLSNIRLGAKVLKEQTITFIPHNPYLKK